MNRALALILIVALALAGCGQPTPLPPTSTPAPSATPTATFTPTATPTITPTATSTATPTPRPTWTASPPPSATPEGQYTNMDFGFALNLPEGWEVLEEGESVVFGSQRDALAAVAFSAISPEQPAEGSFDAVIQGFTEGAEARVVSKGEATFKDGQAVQQAVVTIQDPQGPVTAWLYYTWLEPREYVFAIVGPEESLARNAEVLQQMVGSIQLQDTLLPGVERDQALVLQGGSDPEPEDLDPARTQSGAQGWTGLLYSGLVILTPDMQIAPDLAERWTISPDGTVYTFTLRADAYFESGRPITADDFKYSWERAADPATDSTIAETYLGDIVGFKDRRAGKAQEISGVEVLDELTLKVTIDAPKPYFLAKLTYPTSFVVDRARVESDPEGWYFNPNASGPFRLRAYSKGSMLAFEPNPGYPVPPRLPALIYLLYLPGKSIDYYDQGQIDIAYLGDPADIEAVQSPDSPLHAELTSVTSSCTGLVQLNNNLPPMDDPNVRKALALSLDRQKLLDQFSEGTDLLAESLLPPVMPGYSANLKAAGYDLEAAKAALQASKYAGDLPPLTLFEAGYAGQESDYTNALVDQWTSGLGITINVEYLDPVDFTKAARAGKGHIVLYGWCADYPDPENFLDVLYHTDSRLNVANYSNPEVDSLLEQARTELDPAKRIALYQQIERLLLEDYATIPLSHGIAYALVKPEVKGFVLSPVSARVFDKVTLER